MAAAAVDRDLRVKNMAAETGHAAMTGEGVAAERRVTGAISINDIEVLGWIVESWGRS